MPANTDFELGWTKQIQTVQKPAFSGVPGTNTNFNITQDSSPWDIFEICFIPEMFRLIQKETNWYAMQQINKKKQEGLLTPKSVFAQCNTVSLQEIKKFLYAILICFRSKLPSSQAITAALPEYLNIHCFIFLHTFLLSTRKHQFTCLCVSSYILKHFSAFVFRSSGLIWFSNSWIWWHCALSDSNRSPIDRHT
jgi:hypothetical protein